ADDLTQILGVETRGQGCRPNEIAEHDGQLPPLCFSRNFSLCGTRGSSRMLARGRGSLSRETAAAGGCGGWNWVRLCVASGELGNGFEQFAPVPYRPPCRRR